MPNQMVVALLNVEREGAMGISAGFQTEGKGFLQKVPPVFEYVFCGGIGF